MFMSICQDQMHSLYDNNSKKKSSLIEFYNLFLRLFFNKELELPSGLWFQFKLSITSVSVPSDIYCRSLNSDTFLLFPLFLLPRTHLEMALKSQGLFSSANVCCHRLFFSLSAPLHITSLFSASHRAASTGWQARIIHQVRTNEWVWNIFSYLSR